MPDIEIEVARRASLTSADGPDWPSDLFAYLLTQLADAGRAGCVYAEEPDAAGAYPVRLSAGPDGLLAKRRPAMTLATYSSAHLSRFVRHLRRVVLRAPPEDAQAFGWLTVRLSGEPGPRYFTVCLRHHARFGVCFQIDQSSPRAAADAGEGTGTSG